MSQPQSRFALLLDLAREPSSERRRDLLRGVTDLFFESEATRNEREGKLFDDVLRAVAANMEESVLAELAKRFAEAPDAPAGLMRDLSQKPIAVADLVLRNCTALTEEDLLRVVAERGQEHARAIAQRKVVTEAVSQAIVDKGDDRTVDVLMRNAGARLNRETLETVVDRAKDSITLHEAVVMRPDLPLDLLNEMYFVVEQRLRSAILTRNASVDPTALEAALQTTRSRMRKSFEAVEENSKKARDFVLAKKAKGELSASLLVGFYRDKKFNEFLHGLAEMTGLDFETTRQIISRKDIDALAMVCRAANIERPLFVTLAVLACGGDNAMGHAEAYGRTYVEVPVEAAQRAMRFFKVRRGAGETPAPTTLAR